MKDFEKLIRQHFELQYPSSFVDVKNALLDLSPENYISILKMLVKEKHINPVEYYQNCQTEKTQSEIDTEAYLCCFMRSLWIEKYKSWALPPTATQLEDIKAKVGNRKILEIGAGSGLWAAILKMSGLKVIATDSKSEKVSSETYTTVKKLKSCQALRKYGNKVGCLFVSWGRGYPEAESFNFFKGDMVMIIGESNGGCTSAGCLDYLSSNPKWRHEINIYIPRWGGLNDYLSIYIKN